VQVLSVSKSFLYTQENTKRGIPTSANFACYVIHRYYFEAKKMEDKKDIAKAVLEQKKTGLKMT
jgi:hypothetical protein